MDFKNWKLKNDKKYGNKFESYFESRRGRNYEADLLKYFLKNHKKYGNKFDSEFDPANSAPTGLQNPSPLESIGLLDSRNLQNSTRLESIGLLHSRNLQKFTTLNFIGLIQNTP